MTEPSDLLSYFPATWTWRMIQDTDVARALSGQIYARERGTLRFEVTLAAKPMTPETFGPISAFLAKHTGPSNPFHVRVQQRISGSLIQAGNYVNWSDSPHGKLYLITDAVSNPVKVQPSPPTGQPIDTVAYLRCAMKGSSQQIQDDRTGLVTFSLTLEEHLP